MVLTRSARKAVTKAGLNPDSVNIDRTSDDVKKALSFETINESDGIQKRQKCEKTVEPLSERPVSEKLGSEKPVSEDEDQAAVDSAYATMKLLVIQTLLNATAGSTSNPLLPLLSRELMDGAAAAGALMSVFAIARIALNMPIGMLADKIGRRPLLVCGPLFTSLAVLGSSFAPNYFALTFCRLLGGIGSTLHHGGSALYISDCGQLSPKHRTRLHAMNRAAVTIGLSIGPLIGGFAANHLAIYAFFVLPETSAALTGKGDSVKRKQRQKASLCSAETYKLLAVMLMSPAFVGVAAVGVFGSATFQGTRKNFVPLVIKEVFEMGPAMIGSAFSMMAFIQFLSLGPVASFADKRGKMQCMLVGAGVCTVSLLIMAYAPSIQVFCVGLLV